MKKEILEQKSSIDPRIARAYLELFEKGKVPEPDRMFAPDQHVTVPTDTLALDFGGNTFVKDEEGNYTCVCQSREKKMAFSLKFTPRKKAMRHGKNGVVQIGLKGDEMFYYFVPRMDVTGSLTLGDTSVMVTGQGWYDHEFGGKIR